MNPDLETIRQKVNKLQTHSSRFRLNPPLSESQLVAFEKEYGVTLPDQYRDFLRYIGNGGTTLAGQLYPLDVRFREKEKLNLTRPFPLTEALNDFPEDEDDETFDAHTSGTICIEDRGCGVTALLVVTGSERGNIWIDGRSGDYGIYPMQVISNRGFFAWYNSMLDYWLCHLKR